MNLRQILVASNLLTENPFYIYNNNQSVVSFRMSYVFGACFIRLPGLDI